MNHVAGTDAGQQRLRVVAVGRVLHRVEVIEVAIELIEAVHGRQELVEVTQVVLAELSRGVPLGFTTQVQHLLGCLWRWDNVMASSALRSALRSTACMKAVEFQSNLHLPS